MGQTFPLDCHGLFFSLHTGMLWTIIYSPTKEMSNIKWKFGIVLKCYFHIMFSKYILETDDLPYCWCRGKSIKPLGAPHWIPFMQNGRFHFLSIYIASYCPSQCRTRGRHLVCSRADQLITEAPWCGHPCTYKYLRCNGVVWIVKNKFFRQSTMQCISVVLSLLQMFWGYGLVVGYHNPVLVES